MSSSSVAICGLARDCATNLKRLIPQVKRLASSFGSYRFIVVENDSADETGAVLSDWAGMNPHVRPVQYCYQNCGAGCESQDLAGHGGWFGYKRMERMAFARNQYLDALAETILPDFVIVVDLDIRSFSLAGVESSFGLLDEWDVVTANGKRFSLRHPLRASVYWDSYAYEPADGFQGDVQTVEQIRRNQTAVADKLKAGQLLAARSAFGGLGIYRTAVLMGHRYSVMKNDCSEVPVLCDHPTLHRSMRQKHRNLRLMINPHMTVDYGSALQLGVQAWRTFTA